MFTKNGSSIAKLLIFAGVALLSALAAYVVASHFQPVVHMQVLGQLNRDRLLATALETGGPSIVAGLIIWRRRKLERRADKIEE